MANNDPFAQFGGQQESDPFAEFGGKREEAGDPFAQFGGKEEPYTAVQKEIEERSFFDRPALGAEYTRKEEIAGIAQKHGVNPKELEELAPYFGARIEGSSFVSPEELKRVVGGVGQLALGLPQKLYKKAQSDKMEAALDDLQNLASGRQSYTQLVGEIAVPGVGVGGRAVTTAGKALAGAATGAVAGYAGSSKQQEIAGTLFGAGLGGAASALGAKLASKKAPKVEKELEEAVIRREGQALDDGAEQILKAREDANKAIQETIYKGAELTDEMANTITDKYMDPDSLKQYLTKGNEAHTIYVENLRKYNETAEDLARKYDEYENAFQMLKENLQYKQVGELEAFEDVVKSGNRIEQKTKQVQSLVDRKKRLETTLSKRRTNETKGPIIKSLNAVDNKLMHEAQTLQGMVDTHSELELRHSQSILDRRARESFTRQAEEIGKQRDQAISSIMRLERPIVAPSEQEIRKALASDIISRELKKFAEELTGSAPKNLEEAREAIQDYASRQGQEATAAKYRLFQEEQAAYDYIKQGAIRFGRGENFQDRALNAMSDAQFVLRDIDERAGTSLEPIHRRMNHAYNKMSFARLDAAKQLNEIFNQNRAVDKVITDTDKLYQAMDSGDLAGLSQEELKAVSQFKEFFNNGLDYVNGLVKSKDPSILPLSIPKRENYVPHMLKSTEELVSEVSRRVDDVKEMVKQSFGREIDDLSQLTKQEYRQLQDTNPIKELKEAVLTFNPKAVLSTGADLSAAIKDTYGSRNGRIRMESFARAALERSGDMPYWMREKNLYKLANKWTTNTLKHLYLRRDMDALRSIANRLEKAGADLEANYVKNLLADINGIRKGTMAERTRQGVLQYQAALDTLESKYTSPYAKGAISAARAIPEVLNDINRQVYPNLLGLSPRAMIMNATQTIAKTAPELGTKYGYTTLMRGALYATLNWRNLTQRLAKEGYAPAEFTAKYSRPIAEGIRRSSVYAIPSNVLRGMGDMAMYLYTKTDTMNRAITLGTAEIMANDLAKGSKLAQQTLNKFPATVRRQVARAGSQQEIADIIGSHLNAATQYNYNRLSMSEYGRAMGPFFSTFSKWPTATAGEIIQEYREKGALKGSYRNFEKYVAPLLLFQMADYLLYGNDPEQMTDRQKKFLGVGGLSQSAPLGSVEGILKGDFFTPPAVDAITQTFVVPVLEGDTNKLQRGLSSAIQNFTPGSVYVRFLTDDIPTIITGERPEGSTFLERTANQLNKVGK